VAICCHDAGAANLISAWAASERPEPARLCAEGPARAVFARECPELVPVSLANALDGAASLLSGSGWASDLEHDARVAARRRGIPTLAVLDHWVNYEPRFARHGVRELPDAFVVTDPEAHALAAKIFGDSHPILLWPNSYLAGEVARIRKLSTRRATERSGHLLVVLEPIRSDWIVNPAEPAEFRALDYLMRNLAILFERPEELSVRLRPHPSEAPAKYESWVQRQTHRRLELSGSSLLAEDLAWADAVAGLQSYALVVALAAHRRAVSYLPPGAPPCGLRHPGLEHLADLTGLAS